MRIKSNKGQALIEFVLILPVALLLVFALIDCGRVLYQKNHLESVLSDVVISYRTTGEIDKKLIKESVTSSIANNNGYTTIALKEEVQLITPFSNVILDNPYVIKTERVFINE